jgi:hypothetical protein
MAQLLRSDWVTVLFRGAFVGQAMQDAFCSAEALPCHAVCMQCVVSSALTALLRTWVPVCLLLALQEDFEMAVAKVMKKDSDRNMSLKKLWK